MGLYFTFDNWKNNKKKTKKQQKNQQKKHTTVSDTERTGCGRYLPKRDLIYLTLQCLGLFSKYLFSLVYYR